MNPAVGSTGAATNFYLVDIFSGGLAMSEQRENFNAKALEVTGSSSHQTRLVRYLEELSEREDVELGYWLLALPAVKSVAELLVIERLLKKALFNTTAPMIATNSLSMTLNSCFSRRLSQLKCEESGEGFETEEIVEGIFRDPTASNIRSMIASALNSIGKIDTSLLETIREVDR